MRLHTATSSYRGDTGAGSGDTNCGGDSNVSTTAVVFCLGIQNIVNWNLLLCEKIFICYARLEPRFAPTLPKFPPAIVAFPNAC